MHPSNLPGSSQVHGSEHSFISKWLQIMEGGWQVEREESTVNSNSSGKSLISSILKTVRKSSWNRYLEILLTSASPNGVTMNEISSKLNEKPQNIHPFLKRLEEYGVLKREKKGKQYHYYLTSEISKEEIELQIKAIANGELLEVEAQLDLSDDEDLEQGKPSENQPEEKHMTENQEVSNRSERGSSQQGLKSRGDRLPILPGLPEFDPTWSEERQNKWFAIYEKLIELEAQKNAN